ncbi:MAG: hypothetical protein ACOYLQ_16835 [Hyphomicrobiaceae bacterium]
MRYLIAMLFAIPVALLATLYVSSPVATWITAQFQFDDPDGVANVHAMAFMATNLLAMVVGWTIGWWVGGAILPKQREI